MKKRRPELGILVHEAVEAALEESQLDSLVAAAAAGDTITPSKLAPLAEKNARHLLFVIVTYNAVDRFVTNHTDVRNVYDEDRKVTGRTVKYSTIAQAKRSVTAEYRVFDILTGNRVWASESSNSRSRSRTADSREGYPNAPDFAAAPTASRVMRSMTTAAVKELPAPEKKSQLPSAREERTEESSAQ